MHLTEVWRPCIVAFLRRLEVPKLLGAFHRAPIDIGMTTREAARRSATNDAAAVSSGLLGAARPDEGNKA